MKTECGRTLDEAGEILRCDKPEGNHKLCSGWSAALMQHVDWPNPAYEPPKAQESPAAESKVRALAAKMNSREAAREGAERAAQSWTPAERMLVESAITEVAEKHSEFTTDQVWAALGDRVPMTSGMAALLRVAQKKGQIEATDRYADSARERADHDHGRRLRVWKSRMTMFR
jgi:hypothetical protein